MKIFNLILSFAILISPISAGVPTFVFQEDGILWYNDGTTTRSLGHVNPSALGNVVFPPDGNPNPPMPPIPPTPPLPPTPPPTPPINLQDQVQIWASEINEPDAAHALAMIYRMFGQQIENGTVKVDDFNKVSEGLTGILDLTWPTIRLVTNKENEWKDFRGDVGSELGVLAVANNGEPSKEQLVNFFNSVADGLDDANEGHAISDFINQLLALLLPLLIQFLLSLFGG